MIDFKEIPDWWAMCPKCDCKMAGQCLRHQVCMQTPKDIMTWNCVLPHAENDGECSFFQPNEKVRMARGFRSIYNNVHAKQARACIRRALTDLLGSKGTYYRYRDGERLLNPRQQQKVLDIVHQYAPEAAVAFDETFEGYDFTKAACSENTV